MAGNYNILCTVCARAGSKGVKNKNIRFLLGKPLIAYTIEQALKWGKARRVVVSTDSKKIANIAKRFGAEIPFMRPKSLAADNAAKLLSVRDALIRSERFFKERFDIVVDLDATAPIRKIKDLDNCLKIFIKKKPKTLFSVVRAHRNPYFNMVEKKGGDGYVKLCKGVPGKVVARQKAPKVYSMNASIYFYSRDFLLRTQHTMPFSNKTIAYVMDELSQYDINSKIDFKFIEFLIKKNWWKDEA